MSTGRSMCQNLKELSEKRICAKVDKDHCTFCQRWKGQYLCAKTCGNTKYCEDPNPNKECKNVAPGKILSASYICQL